MFTVVIPLYNKANTITRTISSVLNQTYQEFEIIVVDDGSTDLGVNIIQQFSKDSRIRIFSQENQGVSVARNRGVRESRYEYIAFLDGDDEWMPDFLSYIKDSIIKYPKAGIYGAASLHIDNVSGKISDLTVTRYIDKIEEVEYFQNPLVFSHTSATVVSKKAFYQIDSDGNGFPIGMKCCEDWSCFYRIALLNKVVYIGKPLGIRNYNLAGQITSVSEDKRFLLLKHVVDFYNLISDFREQNYISSKLFIRYIKYDFRARIISALRVNDYNTVNYLINNLNYNHLKKFNNYELKLYKKHRFNILAKFYIYLTKVWWRRHGYPIVGHS